MPPSGWASATESWSRSRESSLSIEHQSSARRSRVPTVLLAVAWMAASSARAAGEYWGSSPFSRITRWAIRCRMKRA